MARKLDNTKAVEAFVARKLQIDEMLARLTALSAEHFNVGPDEINWGHVGDLEHYAEQLKRITDSAFREGEYRLTDDDPMGDWHGRNK